jgi:hypothetical protein
MSRRNWVAGLLVLGLLWFATSTAHAGRVPSTRTDGQKSTGARVDQTVPYTTNGKSTFGIPVGPEIYGSPTVQDTRNPQAKPVMNLIFYGSVQSFGDKSNGAQERTKAVTPR